MLPNRRRMIYRPPRLDEDEVAVLAAIDSVQEFLKDRVLVPPRWHGETYREIFLRTLDEGVGRKERAPRVPGYNRAMTYVLRRSEDRDLRYDDGLIKALHFMINEDDELAWPGKWRARDAGVRNGDGIVVYQAPAADRIAGLMAELIEYLNSKADHDPPIVHAAYALMNLVRIHAFRDGNGRLARVLHSLVLARAGYRGPKMMSIEEYIGHHRVEFDSALDAAGGGSFEPSRNTRPWLRFCLIAHYRQALELWRDYQVFDRMRVELAADMTEVGVECGGSIATSEVWPALADEASRWMRLCGDDQEPAVHLASGFRFTFDERNSTHHNNGAVRGAHLTALIDDASISAEADPFVILAGARS